MASYTTAFSLSRELLNKIETRRGKKARSWYVEDVLRKAFGMPVIKRKGKKTKTDNPRSPPASNETGSTNYPTEEEVIN